MTKNKSMKGLVMLARVLSVAWLGIASTFILPGNSAKAAYPEHNIDLVVPFAAGGPTDVFARIFAAELSGELGETVVVLNKPGAGGNIGTEFVARAKPDGYTLMIGTVSTHAFNAAIYKKLPFDPLNDFVPVVQIAEVPQVLVVPSSLGVKTLQELNALVKENPGKYSYGSAGNGSSNHVSGAMFASMAGLNIAHIPYKGSGPALNDVLAGRIAIFFDALSTTLPHINAGKLVAIGVAAKQRVSQLQSVPTLIEAGLPDYQSYTWNIVFAPKHTPTEVLSRINIASNKVMSKPFMQERAIKMGLRPINDSSLESTKAYVTQEFERWQPIVKATGAQVD